MSQRSRKIYGNPLREDLEALRAQTLVADAESTHEEAVVSNHYSGLTHTEVAAASLGVDPDAWKPLSFMNTSHYESLIKNNALSDQLARRLEAYKTVASTTNGKD
jgi:hypothetical protein